MAESSISVTAGSGTEIHTNTRTITATTKHDYYTLPGEYPYASYVVSTAATSIATANDHILEVMAGSSLNVRIRRIRYEQSANATAAGIGAVEVWRLSTAGTGGTAYTPAKFDTADSASGATAMALPTAKGTEATSMMRFTMAYRQAVLTTSTQVDDFWEWTQHPGQKPIIIPAGTTNGIAIKSASAFASASVIVTVEFVETAFV